MIDILYEFIVYSGLIIATGLFNIMECYMMNLILGALVYALFIIHQGQSSILTLYNFSVIIMFNLVDSKRHGTKEIDSFNNIMHVDDKCNRISEFVDRLLPKHVETCNQDPRSDPEG